MTPTVSHPEYRVVSGRPIPAYRGGRGPCAYPFAQMSIGDSFSVPATLYGAAATTQTRVSNSASSFCRKGRGKGRGMRFTVRITDDGVTCWRVS